MLLGRSTELNYLNNYYQKDGSQLLVLYGQKNIGKTTLLSEFVKDKPYTYYQARACSEREQKFQWARELELNGTKLQSFPSYQQIFSSMVKKPTYKKVIIIDEFQYIVKSSGDFFNEIVAFSRNDWGSQQTLVVLCSSSIGWIENSMVTRIGTAAYEINGFLKVKELNFLDLVRRYPKFDTEQCINAYAILGGVPGLWKYFNTSFSIKENIEKYVLKKGCYLYEEGSRYVSEELRETSVYYAILATLASGKHKLNDLYQHTGFSRAKISVYLKNLMELEIVEKVFSFDTAGKDNTQKGIYRICNHYVAFWFKYLYP
ncbi:MAG: ATP-binding protein, partial [Eubacteriales bacterium]